MKVESKHLLEICIDSFDQAKVAIDHGADRLECCSRLDLDGLTPDLKMVEQIVDYSDIPLRVMIRPRAGDFCYSNAELADMLTVIDTFKKLRIEGFVWGCLIPTGHIDTYVAEELMNVCKPYPVTFHRAFDVIKDKERAIHQLIEMNVDSILTSGAPGKAFDHLEALRQLQDWSANDIKILAGGGVVPENAQQIIETTGITHLHASLNVTGKEYDASEKVKRLKSALKKTPSYRES